MNETFFFVIGCWKVTPSCWFKAHQRLVGDFAHLGFMLLFLIGLSAAQLFQFQLTSQLDAHGQFRMTGGAAARHAVESLASPPWIVRPCAEKAYLPWALCAAVPVAALTADAVNRSLGCK